MRVDVRHIRGVTVAQPDIDRLHMALAEQFRQGIGALAERSSMLIIDLCRVRYLDSAGLGALLSIYRESISAGHKVCIVGVRPQVATLLRIVRLDRVIEIFTDMDQALDHWAPGEPALMGADNEYRSDGREQR